MGRVWKAEDVLLGRAVALKELTPPDGLSADEEQDMRLRSLREARALARLNHPHVVQIFDVVRPAEGDPWLVMEYVTGRSLHHVLADEGTLPPPRVAQIGLSILGALQAAHRAGVIHRDVKPGNILLSDDGRVLLTDFGLATAPGDPHVTRVGEMFGSPAYMAPERARDGTAGVESDLWSLGATLYTAVEGHPPFGRATPEATLSALALEPVPEPVHAGALAPALIGLLHKDPAARLSAMDAARLLQRAATGGLAALRGQAPVPRAAVAPPVAPTRLDGRPRLTGGRPGRARPSPAPGASPAGSAAGRPARRPGRIRWIGAALAVLAVALLAFLAQGATGRGGPSAGVTDDPGSPAAPTSTPAATPSTSAAAAGSTPPTTAAAALPPGWTMGTDGTGFAVPVPQGWIFSRDQAGRAQWRDPAGTRLLLIDQSRHPKPDPVKDWLNNEAARRSGYANYHRIRIVAVDYWDLAADWEFTYTISGAAQHVLNRGFVTAPDQAYSIYWSTPDAQWTASQSQLQVILTGFRPARS